MKRAKLDARLSRLVSERRLVRWVLPLAASVFSMKIIGALISLFVAWRYGHMSIVDIVAAGHEVFGGVDYDRVYSGCVINAGRAMNNLTEGILAGSFVIFMMVIWARSLDSMLEMYQMCRGADGKADGEAEGSHL